MYWTFSRSADHIPSFQAHETLLKTFKSGVTLPLEYRRRQLLQLSRMFQDNVDTLIAALQNDIKRHGIELALVEFGPIIGGALRAAEALKEWTSPEKPKVEEWRSDYDTTIYKVPKGVVTIIGYCTYYLIGAIAAGCTVVYKPSELSPHAAAALTELFPKYLDPKAYTIVNGAASETSHLLSFKWNHIFFTGSRRVGQIVAEAAAKHITPVTLELGGKCPVYIDAENTALDLAAKRILWGKQLNAGQICVAPDYVLVPRAHQERVVEAFKKAYRSFFPKGGLDDSSHLATIVNPMHFDRLEKLLQRCETSKVVTGGGLQKSARLDLTILRDVALDHAVMEDEIFGPILAIVPVDGIDEAIQIINTRPVPLVIYVFTDSESTKEQFLHQTQSGTLTMNDTVQQLSIYEMPFGGNGDSGYGSYLGKYSFETFVHNRSYINVPPSAEQFVGLRYPPYSEEAFKLLSGSFDVEIPEV
ncbi:aldehyde dehydrogenase [Ramaria rubella]|nr:aldehyde dehydrogenase [Ramaria rubella]